MTEISSVCSSEYDMVDQDTGDLVTVGDRIILRASKTDGGRRVTGQGEEDADGCVMTLDMTSDGDGFNGPWTERDATTEKLLYGGLAKFVAKGRGVFEGWWSSAIKMTDSGPKVEVGPWRLEEEREAVV